jgi:hypothetical protein
MNIEFYNNYVLYNLITMSKNMNKQQLIELYNVFFII